MMMARRPDWAQRLSAVTAEWQGRKWRRFSSDCVSFVNASALAMTDVEIQPGYADAPGRSMDDVMAYCMANGYTSPCAMWRDRIVKAGGLPWPKGFVVVGDIVEVTPEALGIVSGHGTCMIMDRLTGLTGLQIGNVARAWRISFEGAVDGR